MSERWPVVVESVALVAVYGLGLVLAGLVWLPLAGAYGGVIVAANLLFMALICPYCRHCEARTCHSGYHHIARWLPRREGRNFDRQFRRYVAVMYPVWFIPPVLGLYRLVTAPDWLTVVLLAGFGVAGLAILPYASQRLCAGCANAAECPRGRARPE